MKIFLFIHRTAIVLTFALVTLQISAQDYSKQVKAFQKSLETKNVEDIKPYLSKNLKFNPIPADKSIYIITNIVKNLPKAYSMKIVSSEKGKAKVEYDFDGFGVTESYIYFDDEEKIIKIELVEFLIKQEMEQQKKLQEQSVQLPSKEGLAKKHSYKEVQFKAKDGLLISGNLYEIDPAKPVILLCHQAGYNKEEYIDIAPRLNALGFNCLSIDQRSGGKFAEKENETNTRAKEQKLDVSMFAARADMKAAIDYLHKKYNQEVIVWGSSYSSSLALIEGQKNTKVKAILAFSPGDYFGKETPSLSTIFDDIDKPYFVTSSKGEAVALTELIGKSQREENQHQFIPTSDGYHGSKAVWIGQKGGEEYWKVVVSFLNEL